MLGFVHVAVPQRDRALIVERAQLGRALAPRPRRHQRELRPAPRFGVIALPAVGFSGEQRERGAAFERRNGQTAQPVQDLAVPALIRQLA